MDDLGGQPSDGRFGIGQSVPRIEDPALLRGRGRYTDDINLPGQAWGVPVRSVVAHGHLRGVDTSEARAMPGVLAIYTAEDLTAAGYAGIGPLMRAPNRDGSLQITPLRPSLATDRVRFVGEALAFVVARTLAEARDAAEAVYPDIESLPAVTDMEAAAAPEAPVIHAGMADNVSVDFHWGDADAVASAFARAAHVTSLTFENNRIVVAPMEPRAAIGEYDPLTGRYTLHAGTQGVFSIRNALAPLLGVEPDQVRVLTGNVGGSFGMKISAFPEFLLVLHAAKALGRPVKWRDERSDSFVADHAGRDHRMTGELALDAEGNFLAVRLTGYGNCGAWPIVAIPFTANAVRNVASLYKTPLIEVASRGVFTNTAPVGAYRGAGRPEGNYYMERLIDQAARETGRDRVALRRLNQIPCSALPFKAGSEAVYDSGDFAGVLDDALALADVAGFSKRRAASEADGKLRGLGIASYLEVTAPSSKEMGGIRFERDGTITMITGTLDYGQGHASPFAQVLVSRLGLPFDKLRLLQGDSDALLAGGGTGGSRSIMASGTAFVRAADQVIERGKKLAGHVLEASPVDIEFNEGRFEIVGTDRFVGIMELVRRTHEGVEVPEGEPDSLDVGLVVETPPSTYPNGCHIAEVEIDPDTGEVAVVRYAMVNDFGTLVNPMLVEGQAHGGIAQGIGQALMERTVYDGEGQLLTGSFTDYQLPRAADLPMIRFGDHPVARHDQPAGRQRLRRGRLCRLVAGGDECGRRRAGAAGDRASRHAGDAGTCLARASAGRWE